MAEKANKDPNITANRILASMPAYMHPLPRRVWIKSFKENLLIPDDPRFVDLK
jgi:hypothetical protein